MNPLILNKYLSFVGNLFLLNCLYLLVNLPMVLMILFFPASLATLIFFLLPALLITPATVALFATCGRWQREKQINVLKDFFHDYRQNFKLAFTYGMLAWGLFFILIIDALWLLNSKNFLLLIFIVILLALAIMMYLLQCGIIGRFTVNFKSLLRVGIYGVIRYFPKLFFSASCLIILLAILAVAPAFGVAIGFSAVGYFIMTYLRPVLEKFEEEFIQ